MTLIKLIPHKGTIMNIWENLQIYKHKTQNKLIPEQIQNMTQFSKHSTLKIQKKLTHTPQSHTIIPILKNQNQWEALTLSLIHI